MNLIHPIDSDIIGMVCFGDFGEGLITGLYTSEGIGTYAGLALTNCTMTFVKKEEITIDYSKSPTDCLNWIDSYINNGGRTKQLIKNLVNGKPCNEEYDS